MLQQVVCMLTTDLLMIKIFRYSVVPGNRGRLPELQAEVSGSIWDRVDS
jgi:hypothetical protein